jgi:hypothetical protein
MTLSEGQALAGAHIPALVPLGETAELPPNAPTLRAVRRASITWRWPCCSPYTP